MKRIGFTGTRHGMTPYQRYRVRDVLARAERAFPGPIVAHHGDCIGADAEFHEEARGIGARVVGHPPTETRLRAFCLFDEERKPLAYHARNAAIVVASDFMIAAPHEDMEVARGGTWSTVRVARLAMSPLIVCWPDGHVSTERWTRERS